MLFLLILLESLYIKRWSFPTRKSIMIPPKKKHMKRASMDSKDWTLVEVSTPRGYKCYVYICQLTNYKSRLLVSGKSKFSSGQLSTESSAKKHGKITLCTLLVRFPPCEEIKKSNKVKCRFDYLQHIHGSRLPKWIPRALINIIIYDVIALVRWVTRSMFPLAKTGKKN